MNPVTALVQRAQAAGYPVLHAAAGQWPDHDARWTRPDPTGPLAPNDLLDAARQAARDRVAWVHAVLPTAADAVELAAALQPAPQNVADPAWRRLLHRPTRLAVGDPRRVPFSVLVDQTPIGAVTLTVHHDGHTVHVVEIPAPWLSQPLPEVTR